MKDKILKIIVGILMLIGIYYIVNILSSEDEASAAVYAGPVLQYTLYLVYITGAIAVIFSLMALAQQPKKLLPVAVGLGVLLVVYFISAGQASSEVIDSYRAYDISSTQSGWVGTGLFSFYWLAAIAVGVAVFSEIAKAFK